MRDIYVTSISLAAILASKGLPIRKFDPVTRENRMRDGRLQETAKWWFEAADDAAVAMAEETMEAYFKARDWKEFTLDPKDPVYWMKSVLENRNALLSLYKDKAILMTVIENGGQTIMIGPRLSERDKQTLKTLI